MDEEQGLIIQNNVVVGCNSQLSDVVIPAGVTGIAEGAFRDSSLISVTIPTGLREVGAEAFSGCEWLHKVEFPSGLETVGERAFADCVCLTRVVLPDTLREMSWDAFFGCVMLKKVELSPDNPFWRQDGSLLWKRDGSTVIFLEGSSGRTCQVPEGIRLIPSRCFHGSRLEEITLPNSVEEIQDSAFGFSLRLTTLRFPARLRRLEKLALYSTALAEAVLPASLRVLGRDVFQGTITLERLVVLGEMPEGWNTFGLSILGIQPEKSFDFQADRIPMKKISRGSHPAILRNFARRWSAGETIPEETRKDRLEFIRRRQASLRKDPAIQNILLDEKLVGIKEIDGFLEEAAANDPELTARILEYKEKYIDREEKERLEKKKIQRELRALTRPEPTLSELKRLWPGRVLEDGSWEVRGYGGATDALKAEKELMVPAFLKKMPVTAIAPWALSPDLSGRRNPLKGFLDSLRSIRLPDSVRRIGHHAFKGCRSLEQVQLPPGLEELPESAFESCWMLKRVVLPPTLKRIRTNCFFFCSSLDDLELPEGLEELEDGAFANCSTLSRIRLPRSLRVIGEWAFSDCQNLTEVEVEPGIHLESLGENAFRECKTLKRVGMLEGLRYLPDEAFYKCYSLTSFAASPGLEHVGRKAFRGCKALEELDISGVETLGEASFSGCQSLKRILLSPALTELPESVFEGCHALSAISLPEGLRRVGKRAFKGCSGLEEIRLPDSVEVIAEDAFNGTALRRVVASRGSWAYRWAKENGIRIQEP